MFERVKKLLGVTPAAPEKTPEELEEERLAKQEAAAKKRKAKRQQELEQRRKRMMALQFQRTIEDMQTAGGGNFAMDAGLQDSGAVRDRIRMDEVVIDRTTDYFIGWQSMAVLMQNWLISRACAIPAEDAIAPGWQLSYIDGADADNDGDGETQREQSKRLQEMEDAARKFGIAEICKKAEVLKRGFGYCLVVPRVDGVDMSKPFNIDAIRKGSYKGLTVIEPLWVMPQFAEDGRDPASPDFYNPVWYVIAGNANKRIHRSWVVKLVNVPVADVLKPTYFFGGVSLTQQIFRRVYAAETVANEAPNLAMTKRMVCVEGNVENAIANPDLAEERMRAAIEWRDNYGILLTDNDSKVTQLETSLNDFEALIMTQYQLVASIAQMPVTKLLKVQVKGFDNAGEYETNDYNQTLRTIQANDYTPIVELHNLLYGKSEYGEKLGLSVRWNEILTPTPKENAEIQVLKAQRNLALINGGVISPNEAREQLRNDEGSEFTELPEERDDLEDAELFDDPNDDANGNPGDEVGNLGKLHDGLRGVKRAVEASPYATQTNNGGAEG